MLTLNDLQQTKGKLNLSRTYSKTTHIQIRLSLEDKHSLVEQSTALGLSLSDYIRLLMATASEAFNADTK